MSHVTNHSWYTTHTRMDTHPIKTGMRVRMRKWVPSRVTPHAERGWPYSKSLPLLERVLLLLLAPRLLLQLRVCSSCLLGPSCLRLFLLLPRPFWPSIHWPQSQSPSSNGYGNTETHSFPTRCRRLFPHLQICCAFLWPSLAIWICACISVSRSARKNAANSGWFELEPSSPRPTLHCCFFFFRLKLSYHAPIWPFFVWTVTGRYLALKPIAFKHAYLCAHPLIVFSPFQSHLTLVFSSWYSGRFLQRCFLLVCHIAILRYTFRSPRIWCCPVATTLSSDLTALCLSGSALVKTMPSGLLPLVFICFPHPSL